MVSPFWNHFHYFNLDPQVNECSIELNIYYFTELRMRGNYTHKIDPSWLSTTARTKFSGTGKKSKQSSFKDMTYLLSYML